MTTDLDVVDLSRWQFGITTVFHHISVPLTIGLAPMAAMMQAIWQRTGHERWYGATRFFGNLFLINFAMGVVTGIMQELQFGMNWPEYASFVGDVFGAPLAFEGLAAFFFESIFLGVWIFGWGRVPAWAYLTSIGTVTVAVNLSASFIIVANSLSRYALPSSWKTPTISSAAPLSIHRATAAATAPPEAPGTARAVLRAASRVEGFELAPHAPAEPQRRCPQAACRRCR